MAQDNRFSPKSLQFRGADQKEINNRIQQCLSDLFQQINNAAIPITIGPNDALPEGLYTGQPVIDWSSGSAIVKVWNGNSLI